jgi:hypothetical protein
MIRELSSLPPGVLAVMLIATGLWTGCAANDAPLPNPLPLEVEAYPDTFARTVDLLRDRGFEVDRQDLRFGRITSRPKGSPTLAEPWIADNTTADQALRSTLGDLRRTVTVMFEPPDPVGSSTDDPVLGEGPYAMHVEVLLERLQVPGRRLNGRTSGGVFADLSATPAEMRARGIEGRYWQPVGRDPLLEQRLLEAIIAP